MKKSIIEPLQQPNRIINYWKKEKPVVAAIIIFGVGYNVAAILAPIYQGRLLDALLRGSGLPTITRLTLIFVLLIGAIQLVRYLKRFYTRRFANKTSATMRLIVYNNIIFKDYTELAGESAGDLMNKTMADVDLCVEGMRKFTTEIFDTGVLMASYFAAMLYYDVSITLLGALFIPAAMLVAERLKNLIYRYSIIYRRKSSMITGMTLEYVDNALLYRINGLENRAADKYRQELHDLQNKAIKANVFENAMQPVYNVIAMLGVVTVIYMGGERVIAGGWTVGTFSAYMVMFAALATKASKAAQLFNSVQKSKISWQRIKPFLHTYQSEVRPPELERQNLELIVEHLSFRYPGGKQDIFDDISFYARTGEIIGVTGPVAAGKTALGEALLGLYPYGGSIRINGRELQDYSAPERSRRIAFMGHEPQLLSDTIYNNITLGRKEDITAVLRHVCLDEDLAAMPEGVDTPVGNGGIRLSGGQQARIALARTILIKPELIILDDPFAAVDMQTEEKIIANLRTHYQESLIIVISHRLAIFNRTDRIVLLHSDGTAEYGTHRQLLENSELYAAIYNLQQSVGEGDG